MFISDMTGRSPLYKKEYVFFSSPISRDLLQLIKKGYKFIIQNISSEGGEFGVPSY